MLAYLNDVVDFINSVFLGADLDYDWPVLGVAINEVHVAVEVVLETFARLV